MPIYSALLLLTCPAAQQPASAPGSAITVPLALLPRGNAGCDPSPTTASLTASRTPPELPARFTGNHGQWPQHVHAMGSGRYGNVFLLGGGHLTYVVAGKGDSPISFNETVLHGVGVPELRDPASSVCSLYLGSDPSKWSASVPQFYRAIYTDVVPGIDLELRPRGHALEKLFVIRPGAHPSALRVGVTGASHRLSISDAGELVLRVGSEHISFTAPQAYQESGACLVPIAARYRVCDATTYTFDLGDYDASRPVVIDPLLAGTYLGTASVDYCRAIGQHSSGDIYVVGDTLSSAFPGTQLGPRGVFDIFVARFTPDLSTLVASAVIGGSGSESALGIDTSSGAVAIVGATTATDYPGSVLQVGTGSCATGTSARRAIITVLNSALTSQNSRVVCSSNAQNFFSDVVASGSSYFTCGRVNGQACVMSFLSSLTVGGLIGLPTSVAGNDAVNALAISGTSVAFCGVHNLSAMVGITTTALSGGSFVTANFAGNVQGLIDEFLGVAITSSSIYACGYRDSSGGDLVWHLDRRLSPIRLVNTSGSDTVAYAMEIDSGGSLVVCGRTNNASLPTTPNAYARSLNGGMDGYVMRLDNQLQRISHATYLGGSGDDWLLDMVIDDAGEVYVAGHSSSTNFPVAANGRFRANAGQTDGVIAKLDALFYGTLLAPNTQTISRTSGGTQMLALGMGTPLAGASYALAGSLSGVWPGTPTPYGHVPLNFDAWTNVTLGGAPPVFVGFTGVLDPAGQATARLVLPAIAGGYPTVTLHHAAIAIGTTSLVSNPVALHLR